MTQRIDGKSSVPLRGRISAFVRNESVRKLVQSKYDDNGDKTRNKIERFVQKIHMK